MGHSWKFTMELVLLNESIYESLSAQFPIIKDQVLRTSQDELKDFLENIQVNSPKVGTAVLRKYLLKRKPDLDEDHPLISDPT